MQPSADLRIKTVQGALRRLVKHCRACSDEFERALTENDIDWLRTKFMPHAGQILTDIQVLAELVGEVGTEDDAERTWPVARAACLFMASLCDLTGNQAMKRSLLELATGP